MLRKHLIAYLAPNIAQAIASFGTVALLTRFLSAEEYGRFSIVFTIMTIAHYTILTWAEAAAARFYAKAKEENEVANHFKTLLSAFSANAIIFAILAAIFTFVYPANPAMKMAMAAAFAGSIVRSILKIALETRRMDLQANRFALVETTHILLGFVFTAIAVVSLGLKEQGPFIAIMIASIMALLIEGPALLAFAKNGSPKMAFAKDYFRFGYPISIGLILTIILNTGDRFIISNYLGDAEVGAYSAGYQVAARILEIIFTWTASATFPLLVNAFEANDRDRFDQAARNSFAIRFGLGAPCALGIALVSANLCEILIGPEMRPTAIQIAPWIALGGFLAGMSDYFSDAFMLTRKVVERAILLAIPAILNIGLNIILLPKIGLKGAIISTIAAFMCGLILLAIRSRKHIKLPIPMDQIIKIAICCAFMALMVKIIPDYSGFLGLLTKSIIGAISYLIAAISLNLANSREQFLSRIRTLGAKP